MKRIPVFAVLALIALAGHARIDEFTTDSIRVVDIGEVVVTATPRDHRSLRKQPAAVTSLSQQDMQAGQTGSIKSLTGMVPNLFIPDYGSKLTSAVYIRGIGSRINTPSAGLYVDNVPYMDKSAFDFNYADVERIDVLRGPQGTLYGRNAMAGLIHVHTRAPFGTGTDVKVSAGTREQYAVSLARRQRVSDALAFSAGGFYGYSGGIFRNSYNNRKMDKVNEAGGRVRGVYHPTERLKVDLSVNYEYSNQGGYPYFQAGTGKLSINDESNYRRNLLGTGLHMEYRARRFTLSAITGYQHMADRMFLDQDFTEKDLFNMEQKQRLNTVSEEIILKSSPGRRWQWTTGAFGFYQWLKTDAPVIFKKDGIKEMIEDPVNALFAGFPAQAPQMSMTIGNERLRVADGFETPTLNGALYHQSTFHRLFVEGLSLTAGLRVDYEKNSIAYDCGSAIDFDFRLTMPAAGPRPPINITIPAMEAPANLAGKLSQDYFRLLPKIALQYEWEKGNSVYATTSRGYRSGGYNLQMFSDLVSKELKNAMITTLAEQREFAGYKDMLSRLEEAVDVKSEAAYKPEYAWSYEIGTHLILWDGRLAADLSAFRTDTRDQQLARFVESGAGRITANAGKSRSYGAEAAFKVSPANGLTLNGAYGYTHATFKDNEAANDADRYVPFTPMHTFHAGVQYGFRPAFFRETDLLLLNADYNGAARIYWTERNNARQPFYGLLNVRVAFERGSTQVALWGRNVLDKAYGTFYFETRNNSFMQKGRPIRFGVDVRCSF
ncbi:MAG: TonB-dependent receptor [Mediterranea sp.]|nr:TonB-dependent receptor [Mediterranea sp.]